MSSDISIQVTSTETKSERRVNSQWTVEYFKKRLELITGIPPEYQELLFYASPVTVNPVNIDSNDSESLQTIGLTNQSRIHVNDTRPESERLSFTEVEKYEMPKDQYERLDDSVLAWKKTNQLGRFNPDSNKLAADIETASNEHIQTKGISPGKRCMVSGRRGTVRYVGIVPEIPAKNAIKRQWIGVEFDEPVGKNDGSIKNRRYFDAKAGHGSFVLPELIEIGDFEEDVYMEDEDEL